MPVYRLVLEYDGTDFRGWQSQAGDRTVQDTLEAAVATVVGEAVRIRGAGRTDAGVHAEGQVASLALDPANARRFGPGELQRALNAVLPGDLAVRGAAIVRDDFDPRRHVRSKLYRYDVWNGPARSPLRRRSWYWVTGALDSDAMAHAARQFEGTHDFASLQSTGSSVRTTKRTVLRCEVTAEGDGEVRLFVEGTGFLRHMVRTLAGTLIEIGQGRRPADSIPAVRAARERAAAGPTAPALGLTLVWVAHAPPGEPLRSDEAAGGEPPGLLA